MYIAVQAHETFREGRLKPERSLDMSLRFYRMPRLVVLKPSTPVLDAARALENNNIGAVVVQDEGASWAS